MVEPTRRSPPAAAIRSRYAQKLKNPREVWRLVSGGVNISKLAKGLARVAAVPSEPSAFSLRLATALEQWQDRATILLASGDATAIAYRDAMARSGLSVPTFTRDTPSHSFARDGDALWLEEQIVAAMAQR